MVAPLVAGALRLGAAALPKILQGGRAIGGAVLGGGGKLPGGLFTQKALEYGLVVPALATVFKGAGLPFGSGAQPQPPVAIGPWTTQTVA